MIEKGTRAERQDGWVGGGGGVGCGSLQLFGVWSLIGSARYQEVRGAPTTHHSTKPTESHDRVRIEGGERRGGAGRR